MKDLIELILDFEKKVFHLLRDMFTSPQLVVDSLRSKDNRYASPFKFYSLVTSLWIIVFQLGSNTLDLLDEDFILPERLNQFFKSQNEFGLMIFPLVGFVEFVLPIAALNYVVFRKSGHSFRESLALGTYLAGTILLYQIPVLLITQLILFNVFGIFSGFFNNIIHIVLPILIYGYISMKSHTGRKWLVFTKSVFVLLTVCTLSILFISSTAAHEAIHRLVFFWRYDRATPTATLPSDIVTYHFKQMSEEEEPIYSIQNSVVEKHVSMTAVSDRPILKTFINGDSTTIVFDSLFTDNNFSVILLDEKVFLLRQHWAGNDIFAYGIDDKGKLNSWNHYSNFVRRFSKFLSADGELVFSGFDLVNEIPILGRSRDLQPPLEIWPLKPLKGMFIDAISQKEDSEEYHLLVSGQTKQGRLKEVRWLSAVIADSATIPVRSLTLYKNEYSPTKNYQGRFLHNSKMIRVSDTTSIIAFQVMNDSTFATSINLIDIRSADLIWSRNSTFPADMCFFDEIVCLGTRIYLFGRTASVFEPRLLDEFKEGAYMQVFDVLTGELLSSHSLPFNSYDSRRPDGAGFPLSFYLNSTSVYHDDAFIYWSIAGQHFYKIRVD